MGKRGPAPKRAAQRRRMSDPGTRKPESLSAAPSATSDTPSMGLALAPTPREDWHRVAKLWWSGLLTSGQNVYYTEADWAVGYAVAESMHREYTSVPMIVRGRGDDSDSVVMWEKPPSASAMAQWLAACARLLVTEGDRRRAGIELQPNKTKAPEGASNVTDIGSARNRFA